MFSYSVPDFHIIQLGIFDSVIWLYGWLITIGKDSPIGDIHSNRDQSIWDMGIASWQTHYGRYTSSEDESWFQGVVLVQIIAK
jgi:hypothetical protein